MKRKFKFYFKVYYKYMHAATLRLFNQGIIFSENEVFTCMKIVVIYPGVNSRAELVNLTRTHAWLALGRSLRI